MRSRSIHHAVMRQKGSITIQHTIIIRSLPLDLHEEDLDADELSRYPMITECEIHWQNKN